MKLPMSPARQASGLSCKSAICGSRRHHDGCKSKNCTALCPGARALRILEREPFSTRRSPTG